MNESPDGMMGGDVIRLGNPRLFRLSRRSAALIRELEYLKARLQPVPIPQPPPRRRGRPVVVPLRPPKGT
jgi:hypothetical protein